MNLSKYEQLFGVKVASDERALFTSQVLRTRLILEAMLGFTLDTGSKRTQNLYTEQGKTQQECSCSSVDTENLLPADAVQGAYRMYDYVERDSILHVDPFTELYKVKLVKDGVTIRTYETDEYRASYGLNGIAKFIEFCDDCFFKCKCLCKNCVQVAVDAKWGFEAVPDDLLMVWGDMITYYADCKRYVKSESIGAHSYSLRDRKEPESEAANMAIIRKYAGPHGSVTRTVAL